MQSLRPCPLIITLINCCPNDDCSIATEIMDTGINGYCIPYIISINTTTCYLGSRRGSTPLSSICDIFSHSRSNSRGPTCEHIACLSCWNWGCRCSGTVSKVAGDLGQESSMSTRCVSNRIHDSAPLSSISDISSHSRLNCRRPSCKNITGASGWNWWCRSSVTVSKVAGDLGEESSMGAGRIGDCIRGTNTSRQTQNKPYQNNSKNNYTCKVSQPRITFQKKWGGGSVYSSFQTTMIKNC